jgi:excisionase family DNA binding protein
MSVETSASTNQFRKVTEIANYLGLAPQTVRTLISEGSLPALRIGRIFLVKQTALDDYLRGAAVNPQSQAQAKAA